MEVTTESDNRILFYSSLLVVAFTVITTIYFILSNNVPLSWDPALHMTYSYIYYRLISSFNFGEIVHVSNYYPPFFALSSILMYLFFGFSIKSAIATNIIYYAVLIYSVYGIARTLRGEKAGYFAVILISAYPFLLVLQREYMLDFAFTGMVALTVYLFLKSECLRNLRYSALFGIAFGLATLTKWNAFVYVMPFVLSEIYFEYDFNELKDIAKNAALSAILAFSSAAWWYLPNLTITLKRLEYFASIGGKEGDPTFWTLRGWLYYIKSLDFSVGLIFFILFLVSVIWLVYKNKMGRHEKSILIAVLVAYIVLTFLSNKDNRYILPVLPYVAVITGEFLDYVTSAIPKWKLAVVGAVTVIALVQVSAVTFAFPAFHNPYVFLDKNPQNQNWHVEDVLATIAKYARPGDVVITLADHPYLNGQSLEFYRIIHGYSFRIFNGPYLPTDLLLKNFKKLNFIVVIEPRVHKGVYGKREAILYSAFYKYKSYFKLIGEYKLPDNSTVYIYMNKKYH